ncbi:hypothetical protein [Duganella aceris]|nr:hypothetical protein [Duganella aceris]
MKNLKNGFAGRLSSIKINDLEVCHTFHRTSPIFLSVLIAGKPQQ